MKAQVSLVRCRDYNSPQLGECIEKSLDFLGGVQKILKPGGKVFVKINHLSPGSPPERCIVTHPSFTKEVLRLLKDMEMDITVGDDVQPVGTGGFLISGYQDMCREMGVRLINLKSEGFREVSCPGGDVLQSVYVSTAVLDSDCVLNLPKLKTHALTGFTGAVKNMYGIIPFGLRQYYHNRFSRIDVFSRMLADVLSCAPPQLTIMDGVMAMEGHGPSGGTPRPLGLVLASRDAVALDALASAIIGFHPDDILSTRYAGERGLGVARLEAADILGQEFESVRVSDFKKPALPISFLLKKLPSALHGFIFGQLGLTPEVVPEACVGCQECFKACPPKAVRMEGQKAFIMRDLCIHCLCCHEVCRFNALRLHRRPLGKAIEFIGLAINKASGFGKTSKLSEKNRKI